MPHPHHEIVGNIHIHTIYSDGSGTHADIAACAARAGLDFVIITDHSVFVPAAEGWYGRVLVLVGEETNDPDPPHNNHLLCLGIRQDVAPFAGDPQGLIDEVRRQGGIAFLAHPFERPGPFIGEPAIPWTHWHVEGYTGLCIWNYMSEFKSYLTSLPRTLFSVFFPHWMVRGPFPETLDKLDALLADGRRVAVIGGSDAHANRYSAGPLSRVVFPYERLFHTVNTHILLERPLSGRLESDRPAVYDALKAGRAFIGYHVLGDPRGFRFWAENAAGQEATYGETLPLHCPLTLTVESPLPARLRIRRAGELIAEGTGRRLRITIQEPGAYRAEAFRRAGCRWRGWVFTNPIYISRP